MCMRWLENRRKKRHQFKVRKRSIIINEYGANVFRLMNMVAKSISISHIYNSQVLKPRKHCKSMSSLQFTWIHIQGIWHTADIPSTPIDWIATENTENNKWIERIQTHRLKYTQSTHKTAHIHMQWNEIATAKSTTEERMWVDRLYEVNNNLICRYTRIEMKKTGN